MVETSSHNVPISDKPTLDLSAQQITRRTALRNLIGLAGLLAISGNDAFGEKLTPGETKILTPSALELSAIQLSEKMMQFVRARRVALGHEIDPRLDPQGLIGPKDSSIVTIRGAWHTKRFATEPEWAGAIVKILQTAGFKKGDVIGVGMTGSVPGLNINYMAALKVMGIKPIIISSAGSSEFGASNPDYPWPAMQADLFKHGMGFPAISCSIGGSDDIGISDKPEKTIAYKDIQNLYKNLEIPALCVESLEDSIAARKKIYHDFEGEKSPKGYHNFGGGEASIEILKFANSKGLPVLNFRHAADLFGEAEKDPDKFYPVIPEPYKSRLTIKLAEIRELEPQETMIASR